MIFFFRKSGHTHVSAYLLLLLALTLILPSTLLASGEDGVKGKHHHAKESRADFLASGERAPEFNLISQDGSRVELNDFQGSPVFITFTYTSCRTSCSLILQNLDFIKKKVSPDSALVFLALTVDPLVDTAPVLKEYIENTGLAGTGLTLLTGSEAEVKRVLRKYRVRVPRIAETGEVLGHPNMGYLIGGDGLIREVIVFET